MVDGFARGVWGAQAFELLADAAAMNRLQTMPFASVTNDGWTIPRTAMVEAEFVARIVLLGIVMRTRKRRKEERGFQRAAAQWAQDVLHRMTEPDGGS